MGITNPYQGKGKNAGKDGGVFTITASGNLPPDWRGGYAAKMCRAGFSQTEINDLYPKAVEMRGRGVTIKAMVQHFLSSKESESV